jgi:hypothetical protein
MVIAERGEAAATTAEIPKGLRETLSGPAFRAVVGAEAVAAAAVRVRLKVGEQGTMKVAKRLALMKRTTSILIIMIRTAIIIIIIIIIITSITSAKTGIRERMMPPTIIMTTMIIIMTTMIIMTTEMIMPARKQAKTGGGNRQNHRSSKVRRLKGHGLGETGEQHELEREGAKRKAPNPAGGLGAVMELTGRRSTHRLRKGMRACGQMAERGANAKHRSRELWQLRKREKNYGGGVEDAKSARAVARLMNAI